VAVSAATGIEVNTRKMLAAAGDYGWSGHPDQQRSTTRTSTWRAWWGHWQETFGKNLLPLNLPTKRRQGRGERADGGGGTATDFGDVEEARWP